MTALVILVLKDVFEALRTPCTIVTDHSLRKSDFGYRHDAAACMRMIKAR